VADARVAELEDVLEGGRGARLAVEADRRAARRLRLHQHHVLVWAERIRGGHLEQQVAIDRSGAECLERLRLPVAVVLGVDQDHHVAGLLRGPLRASQHAAEERVRHVGHEQRDRARGAEPQRLRRDVRPVAQLARALADALGGGLGHAPARLAGQDQRHGGLGDARALGHVDAGWALDGEKHTVDSGNHT
jgi:hypothetical protein